ncbi:MAG: DUF4190 domain-containing protein [Myxococcales bacterium]|nr:DUF4190 domain-containing protein [Myxococcales bacterium]
MYTIRIGELDETVPDIPTLVKRLQIGEIKESTAVYDHDANVWRTAGEIVKPPRLDAAPADATPPRAIPVPAAQTMATVAPPSVKEEPTIPGQTIAALILSITGTFTCMLLNIAGIVLGYQSRRLIRENPDRYTGGGLATAAIVIGWIAPILVIVVGIVLAISIPALIKYAEKSAATPPPTVGYQAKLAEELYFQNREPATYTDSLAALLTWDQSLTDDPAVTFLFGPCNQSGYTFTTKTGDAGLETVFTSRDPVDEDSPGQR